ncbi:MAG: hypothetical protein JJU00_12780 [Opitutales bacterium]|nr:hypothetical protein [Opitutales bacterium]
MTKQEHEIIFPSMAAAHRATGIPRAAIRRAKVANCGAFTAGGRIRLRPLVEWLLTDRGADAADPDADWKTVRAERERFRLERDRGHYYEAAAVEDRCRGTVARMQRELERRLLAVVPGEGAHLCARDLSRVLKSHLAQWAEYCAQQAERIAGGMKNE